MLDALVPIQVPIYGIDDRELSNLSSNRTSLVIADFPPPLDEPMDRIIACESSLFTSGGDARHLAGWLAR